MIECSGSQAFFISPSRDEQHKVCASCHIDDWWKNLALPFQVSAVYTGQEDGKRHK